MYTIRFLECNSSVFRGKKTFFLGISKQMTEKCMSEFYMIRAMTSVYKAGILVSNWDNLGD